MLKQGFYIIFCLLLVASANRVSAQQDPQFSQYMYNNLYITPAAAGVDGITRFTALHRSQWLGYQSSFGERGAPTSQLITFSTPIYKLNSGFGTYVLHDQLGPQNNIEIQTMYAYHLGIRESKLSLALKVGAYAQTFDYDQYRTIQPEPALEGKAGRDTQIQPDIGVGAMFRTEKYYVGVGFNHLTKASFDFGGSTRNSLDNHVNFTLGYYYDVNFDLQLMPTALIKTDFNEYSFDLGLMATYRNTMWGGLSFRESEALNAIIGYALLKDKSLKLGYSIDVVLIDKRAKSGSSHEIMLTYELPVNPGSGKKIVRTPRYRH